MPLSTRTTPANGDERPQIMPRLDALHIRTGQPGRPRKHLKVLATDKGYDAKDLRQRLRTLESQPGVEEPQTAGQADPTGCPALPSRAEICLVSAEVSPLGRALGTYCILLQRVACDCHDSYVGP